MDDIIKILENTQVLTKHLTTGNLAHKRTVIYANIEMAIVLLKDEQTGQQKATKPVRD